MFFNKTPQPTSADLERRRLLHKLYVANQHLAERAELVIVRRGVVDLYPDGPDKELAEADLDKAKKSLLCAIGTSDGVRAELMRYVKDHYKDFVTTAGWVEPYTSHEIIEKTWRKFFQQPAKAVVT